MCAAPFDTKSRHPTKFGRNRLSNKKLLSDQHAFAPFAAFLGSLNGVARCEIHPPHVTYRVNPSNQNGIRAQSFFAMTSIVVSREESMYMQSIVSRDTENQTSTGARRYKVLYIQVNTTTFAGIERVVDSVCTLLTDQYAADFDIDVLYTSVQKDRPRDPRNYTVIDRVSRGKIGLMRAYRETISKKKYDLIVIPQIEPTVICMTACLGLGRKFAVYLHGNPKLERSHLKAKILFFLMRTVFLSRLSYVFGISARQLECFQSMFNSKRPQYQLPNPIRRFEGTALAAAGELGFVTFVNVGRFDFQKGQDLLLEAFAELLKIRPNARLKLVGHGGTERELRDMIERFAIGDAVTMEYYPVDPKPAFVASDVYVSTSRWEGWSLAICEALRFGLPVVATDCEFGPNEILIDERLGRIVPVGDRDRLLAAMAHYCDFLEDERKHSDFRKEYIDNYSPERVVDLHAQALHAAIKSA